jgi:hypothetical protein
MISQPFELGGTLGELPKLSKFLFSDRPWYYRRIFQGMIEENYLG